MHDRNKTSAEVKLLENKYLTEAQVSEMTGLALSTLRNWRVLGKGPAYVKPGGTSVRYRKSDIEKFMEARRVVPGGVA